MSELYKRVAPYLQRIAYDAVDPATKISYLKGGDNIQDLLLLQRNNEELKDYIKVAFCPELYGSKIRTSGINNFITKGYNNDSGVNDYLTQTSSTNQPYLDKIAPNERLSAKNPNGDDCYLTHSTVSFGANDEWTVETTLNWNGEPVSNNSIWGSWNDLRFGLKLYVDNRFVFYKSNGSTLGQIGNTTKLIGKNKNVTVVYKNSTINIYIDGTIVETLNSSFSAIINSLYRGWFDNSSSITISSHHIFSKALSANQIAERASILRSIFPEVPFTRIGEQIWSVRNYEAIVTPMGNLIAEMQANGNVEKITNVADREFTSNTGWWSKSGGVTIIGGVANFNAQVGNGLRRNTLTLGKYYKIIITATRVSGTLLVKAGSSGTTLFITSDGIYTFYSLCSGGTYIEIASNDFIGTIDNISWQEIGWSGSQELYDGIYAQTSGTVEQKTYAAVKAAAMWCHYNNDVNLGATYGKLYNWFAVKLLQMDIDYYNAANPTTPFGWRVPTQADFSTLATTLGGESIAGGKIKMPGTTYWNSPNTGADNSSGFSGVGGGRRLSSGGFEAIKEICEIVSINNFYFLHASASPTQLTSDGFVDVQKIWGCSLRLIKS